MIGQRCDFHGLHMAPPRADATIISWVPAHTPLDPVRVRAHTCVCLPVRYELCTAGSWWIRRTKDGRVEETAHTSAKFTGELWGLLLAGMAR